VSNATVYLICGSTGAGKSTYARRLASRVGAPVFSIDKWMSSLFWSDGPAVPDAAWSLERVRRCKLQIWDTVVQAASLGLPCILDWGFPSSTDRAEYFAKGQEAGLPVELHVLDVDAEERWRRVQSRNAAQSHTGDLPFAVTREMFDFVESLWEPPSATELREYRGSLGRSE
jgi:predicted kinase